MAQTQNNKMLKTHNKTIKPFATLTGAFKSGAPHALLKAPYLNRYKIKEN